MARSSSLPTLKDVAERAEVSLTTASMALSGRTGSAKISPGCIKRVQQAAKALGYRGNYHARTLASGRSFTLGLAVGAGPVSVLEHDFWSHICGGIEATARSRGYDVLLIGGTTEFEPLERALTHLEVQRIDALIVLRHIYQRLPPELLRSQLPIVVVGDGAVRFPQIAFDPAPGIEEAVAHLAAFGHRQVLWVGPREKEGLYAPERYRTVAAAAARHGLSAHLFAFDVRGVTPDDHLLQVQIMHRQLQDLVLPEGCTAIMCYNDNLALALYDVLRQRGLTIPGDISVIGFDDRLGHVAMPTLTTITHALPAIGGAAATLAISLLEHASTRAKPPVEILVPSSLIVRCSTGKARSAS